MTKEITVKGNKFIARVNDEFQFVAILDSGEEIAAPSLGELKLLIATKVETAAKESKEKPLEIPVMKRELERGFGKDRKMIWIPGIFRGLHSRTQRAMVRWGNKPVEQESISNLYRVVTTKEQDEVARLEKEVETAEELLSKYIKSLKFVPPGTKKEDW